MSNEAQSAKSGEAVQTWTLLQEIGFRQAPNPYSTGGTALKYNSTGLELEAIRCMGQHFFEVILVTGMFRDNRQLAEINFDLTLTFKTKQQGLAVLAYSLEDYFKPPFPDWLVEGLANEKSLPWIEEATEAARQAALYKARPHCEIDRDFARILRTRLREFFDDCSDQATVGFHFDGQLLSVDFSATPLVIPASGQAWTDDFSVRANAMIELPSRFRRAKVVVGIWREELEFDDQRYPLYHPSNHSPNLPGIDV